jgi:hypothetical protein
MPSRKKQKNMAGKPTDTTSDERAAITRLTSQDKKHVEDALDIMRHVVVSGMAAANAMDMEMNRLQVTDAERPDEEVADLLYRAAKANARLEVSQVMSKFLTSAGSNASLRKGKYKVSVPMFGPEDVAPFLREPVAEDEYPCVGGSECYVHKIRGWPSDRSLRSLVLDGEMRHTGYCILCQFFLVCQIVLDQIGKDPRRQFEPDPANLGITHTQGYATVINDIQIRFGVGGYKPSMRFTEMDLKPICGVVGSIMAPQLGHFSPYEKDGIWWLSDEDCHFQTPSA